MIGFMSWQIHVRKVLLVDLFITILAWLVWRRRSAPNLQAKLALIAPALEEPLFCFEQHSGLICLNDAAKQTLQSMATEEHSFLLDLLTEALSEAFCEGRMTQFKLDKATLIGLPLFGNTKQVIAVLGVIIPPPADAAKAPRCLPSTLAEQSEPTTCPSLSPPSSTNEPWLLLGQTLHLHPTRPLVRVNCLFESAEEEDWQENCLRHLEESLLRYLTEHANEVQPSEDLFSAVWPDEKISGCGLYPNQKERLRRLVYQLRKRIEPNPRNPRYLCTAHGVGYVLYLEQGT